jgi:hypothetical protein
MTTKKTILTVWVACFLALGVLALLRDAANDRAKAKRALEEYCGECANNPECARALCGLPERQMTNPDSAG